MQDEMDSVTGPVDVREIEREAAEMWYGGMLQAFVRAPEHSPTWLALRALLPAAEERLEALGWHRPRRPEDA
jgi:hypothetical protein